MGGIHATMCLDEVMEGVDSVVTGEAEGVWPQVLEGARHGSLKRRYEGGLAEISMVQVVLIGAAMCDNRARTAGVMHGHCQAPTEGEASSYGAHCGSVARLRAGIAGRAVGQEQMNILLYSPDNEITNNFMPHLWMFLLQSLTPPGHRVFLVDGNAQRLNEAELVRYVRDNHIGLVGIGAMTRMIRKAYQMADAVRAAGIPVVMGGPHVTEVPDEALGRDGGPRHADAVALGEADHTWPRIVADAEAGTLKEIYAPLDAAGKEVKPSLADYPLIPWDRMDLEQFNLIRHFPRMARRFLSHVGMTWQAFHMVPIESGRGCPYGCDFCTVTGFFGDAIRFRSNESVVNELLMLKSLEKRQGGKIAVFFIDDNFAINPRRTKSLLREIIARDAQVPWVAQISVNLLRDEELVSLISQSGGKWIFIGLESIDPENLKSVSKGFNKPEEYKAVLERLARQGIYAITAFIFGMDGDRPGVAQRTLDAVRSWPPGLPVFGLLTPYPATPLYERLALSGRLTRPKHWLEFKPFTMGFSPLGISAEQAEAEVRQAWESSYSPAANASAMKQLESKHIADRIIHLLARLAFRGIYFPQMRRREWISVLFRNRDSIVRVIYRLGRMKFGFRSKRPLPIDARQTAQRPT
ncbi:MAG: radical SAM protein [Acidobacteria bacterium]|nr:radical SAM protein [Acidobacteriota bacterium]